ncbi:Spore coat protein SA [Rosistilla carotiformis]|uniref:Spore coat protein SA n=1 Tax=Rosistilla carotiformis TaxID=2528017 RepID=A0A518JVI0_9BACT|nr:glycosyltransferase family 4 protein [Rosistilla carotiformis]QDV69539.1 Spore coat protein SA [Rosistilla carotiformis]
MSPRYRIAVITRTYPPKGGGIAAAHFNLARCLRKRHDVGIFAFDDNDAAVEPNVTRAKTAAPLAWMLQAAATAWVRRYARAESATNCQRIFRIIPAVRRLNRALRSFRPDFVLCPDNFVPALALKLPIGSKLIWVAHHNFRRFEGNPIATQYSWIDLQLAHRLELRAFQKADAVVAVSQYIADVTSQTLKPNCDIRVIRNFVDTEFLDQMGACSLKSRLGMSPHTTLVYIPSGGVAIKGERYTCEIIRRLSTIGDIAFFVSGAISPTLRFELDQLPKHVVVHSPGPQSYMHNLADVAACDLAVSPTLIENFSSALVEALALGVPVVTWDVGGNRELVESGVNGFIVPFLDMESLIQRAMELANSSELRASMQKLARTSVKNLVRPERVLEEYDNLFQSVLAAS